MSIKGIIPGLILLQPYYKKPFFPFIARLPLPMRPAAALDFIGETKTHEEHTVDLKNTIIIKYQAGEKASLTLHFPKTLILQLAL